MSKVTPAFLADLKLQADRPFGERLENPEILKMLIDEIERCHREIERLRRSLG